MSEDDGIVTARFFEGIAQDGHPVEGPLVVYAPSEGDHGRRQVSLLDGDRAEGVPEEVMKKSSLGRALGHIDGLQIGSDGGPPCVPRSIQDCPSGSRGGLGGIAPSGIYGGIISGGDFYFHILATTRSILLNIVGGFMSGFRCLFELLVIRQSI